MDIATALLPAAPLSAVTPSAAPVPDALATARFSALLQQPAHPVPTALAEPAAITQTTTAATGSVGERILQGMHSVSSDFQTTWKAVQSSLDVSSQSMSMQELLKLQLQLVQVSVQYDLVGKAITRSTQNLDQLVRVQ